MSPSITRWRTLGVGACCAAAGIGGGAIATASASSSSAHHAKGAHHGKGAHGRAHHERRLLIRIARRSATGQAVVHTKQGYKTVSWERGVVQSVSGDSVTLAEGTKAAPYKTVTVNVPSSARVRDQGKKAELSSVTAGQRATIVQLPKRTIVVARTPKRGATH